MNVLVLGLNTRLDVPLQDMLRSRWDAIEAPGDDSGFVAGIRKVGGWAGQGCGDALRMSTSEARPGREQGGVAECRRRQRGWMSCGVADGLRCTQHSGPGACRSVVSLDTTHGEDVEVGNVGD